MTNEQIIQLAQSFRRLLRVQEDDYVVKMHASFKFCLESSIHAFCERYKVRFDSYDMYFYTRSARRVSRYDFQKDPDFQETFEILDELLTYNLTARDQLGEALESYIPSNWRD